jgi:DNA-binding transcriptional LysR family regulator
MTTVSFHLIPALHALLEERSVSGAARRVSVTTPSMSRILARLRATFGDELLVRAGRGLVPTPRALALRDRVAALVADAHEVFAAETELSHSARTLVIRANDALPWLEPLVARVRARAPGISLAFVSEGEELADELRDGRVDLDIGVRDDRAPELRCQLLARDHNVVVVRRGHPLSRRPRTPAQLVRYPHVMISRRGKRRGAIDAALRDHGVERDVVATVPNLSSAAAVVAGTDWVATMSRLAAAALARYLPLTWFELPFALPEIQVVQTWHPRLDRDAAHRVLREELAALVKRVLASL